MNRTEKHDRSLRVVVDFVCGRIDGGNVPRCEVIWLGIRPRQGIHLPRGFAPYKHSNNNNRNNGIMIILKPISIIVVVAAVLTTVVLPTSTITTTIIKIFVTIVHRFICRC